MNKKTFSKYSNKTFMRAVKVSINFKENQKEEEI